MLLLPIRSPKLLDVAAPHSATLSLLTPLPFRSLIRSPIRSPSAPLFYCSKVTILSSTPNAPLLLSIRSPPRSSSAPLPLAAAPQNNVKMYLETVSFYGAVPHPLPLVSHHFRSAPHPLPPAASYAPHQLLFTINSSRFSFSFPFSEVEFDSPER